MSSAGSMRDMFVGIYFQDEATKVIDQIDKKMDEVQRSLTGFGSKLSKTSSGFSSMGKVGMSTAASVNSGMNQSVQSVGKLNQKVGETGSGFSRLKSTIIGVGTAVGAVKVIDKAIGMVKSSVDGAIGRIDTLNGFPTVMEKMGFASEKSSASIDKLSDGIQGLPTTLDGIVGSTKNIALMTGDLDMATDTALSLNNAFIASGSTSADAERGLDQYVKMLSKGKVEADSWSTLQETMGFALNKTAEAFGYTGKSAQRDLYGALQKGKITFDDFNKKIISLNGGVGGFAEIAKESSSGIATSWSNMKTAVTRGTAGIIQSIQDTLKDTPLESIENVVSKLGKGFNTALGFISSGIKSIDTASLSEKISGVMNFASAVKDTISSLWNDSGDVSDIWQKFGLPKETSDGIASFADVIRGTLSTAVDGAKKAFDGFKTGLSWVMDNKDVVIAATAGIAGGFAVFKTISTVKTALDLFKSSTLLSTIATKGFNAALRANPLGMVVTAIGLLVTAGVYLYQNWDTVKEKAGELWGKVKEVFGAIYDWGMSKIQPVTGFFKGLYDKFIDFKNAILSFKPPEWVSSIGGAIGKAAGAVGNFISGSHATGLERVPFDGYVAELHKDEAVLTANQSNALRSAGILSQGSSGTPELNLDENNSGSTPQMPQPVNSSNDNNATANNGGNQFIFNISGNNAMDITQKVREVISDILDSEMQTT
ncbi:hypothetical protein B1B04_08500 [Lysinibacillus sp. KCTC 33748]|uniref:tape measure protein n=1 Tax=unclassified Lysinibacillus TaxID=2636778 RepID=UPI0009A70ED4|nr:MULTISPECIES: tape measure protein [unclassified Lysinibacillus]OXS74918.1 hypothetical protein B1B04_08500 [Lysinibacillus sp. KCTC 33748]SKB59902.1 tape measure domain-containing protein [Lysinibacillus sp. AC-3]